MYVTLFLILGVFGWLCFLQSSYYDGFPEASNNFQATEGNQRLEYLWTTLGCFSLALGFYILFAIGHIG